MRYADETVNSKSKTMLRDFQHDMSINVDGAWAEGAQNVLMNMPTGGGKTVTFTHKVSQHDGPSCVIAHRQELVSQAALALNRERIPHAIMAQKKVIQEIIAAEHEDHGYSVYNSRAAARAVGVNTIIRNDGKDRWFSQVGLVVPDEAHHVLKNNMWGKALSMFTNPKLRGLFPTAHCVRGDGKGLGRDADGLVDRLLVGPTPRELMNRGFLTDWRLICVKSDIEFDETVGPSGEFSMPTIRAATHKSSHIVGDIVKTYLKYAAGKLGITFVVDVEMAMRQRDAFQKAGVPAEIITGETPITTRTAIMKQFRARKILQLISVDCLGEGVDVPAVEVVQLARKTASWQLLCQQVGRALRVMVTKSHADRWGVYSDDERLAIIEVSEKPKAIIIDHVGNILWHAQSRGLPDSEQEYSLYRTSVGGGKKSDAIPMRVCLGCSQPYERFYVACPHCKLIPEVAGRGTPELVDGDLFELSPEVMAALRGEVSRVNGPVPNLFGMPAAAQRGAMRNHHDRYKAQQSLQRYLMLWGGWQTDVRKLSTREAQKLFYLRYGVDYLTAQTLSAADAIALETRIAAELQKHNIFEIPST